MKIKFENLKRIYNHKANIYHLTWLFSIEKENYTNYISFENSFVNNENNIFVIDRIEQLLKELN